MGQREGREGICSGRAEMRSHVLDVFSVRFQFKC